MGTLVSIVVAAAVALPISGFGPVCAGSNIFPTVTTSTCFAEEDLGGDGIVSADEERKGDDDAGEAKTKRPAKDKDDDDAGSQEAKGDEEEERKPREKRDSAETDAGPAKTDENSRAVGGDRDGF